MKRQITTPFKNTQRKVCERAALDSDHNSLVTKKKPQYNKKQKRFQESQSCNAESHTVELRAFPPSGVGVFFFFCTKLKIVETKVCACLCVSVYRLKHSLKKPQKTQHTHARAPRLQFNWYNLQKMPAINSLLINLRAKSNQCVCARRDRSSEKGHPSVLNNTNNYYNK